MFGCRSPAACHAFNSSLDCESNVILNTRSTRILSHPVSAIDNVKRPIDVILGMQSAMQGAVINSSCELTVDKNVYTKPTDSP